MKYKILSAAFASLLSCSAFADVEMSILFGQAKLGSKVTFPTFPLQDSPDFSESDSSLGLRLSFPLGENFAIDVSYQNFGETTTTFVDGFNDTVTDISKVKGFSAGAKGILPLGDSFSLVGRLGLMRWSHDLARTDTGAPSSTIDATGTDLYYGVGAEYSITENFSVGLEYSTFGFDYSTGNTNFDYDVKDLALSLAYKF